MVILSNMDLGSRMKVGSTTLLKSAPGRNCEMICESTVVESKDVSFRLWLQILVQGASVREHTQ